MNRAYIWRVLCIGLALASAALGVGGDSRKAQHEYERGLRLEQAGHWQEAYDTFSASLDAEPTAQAYLHRAKTQLAMERPGKAVDDLTEALRLEPKNPHPLPWPSHTYPTIATYPRVISDL